MVVKTVDDVGGGGLSICTYVWLYVNKSGVAVLFDEWKTKQNQK